MHLFKNKNIYIYYGFPVRKAYLDRQILRMASFRSLHFCTSLNCQKYLFKNNERNGFSIVRKIKRFNVFLRESI